MLPGEDGKSYAWAEHTRLANVRSIMANRVPIAGHHLSFVRRWLRWAEVDRAVAFGISRTVWLSFSGLLTMFLVAIYFTPEIQGYYYTFNSLIAMQVFLELGLSQVIIQFASHEWSKLSLNKDRAIVGDHEARSRLISLGHMTFLWFIIAALLFAIGVGFGGHMFLSGSSLSKNVWSAPWIVLCCLTAVKLALQPTLVLLEGCNQVAEVNACRLIQSIVGSLAMLGGIVMGVGLWVASIGIFMDIVAIVIFLSARYGAFFITFLAASIGVKVDWWKEVWPMQGRFALSTISGYFIFALFTPVLFRFYGPVAAGQMGMTWTLTTAVTAISSVWRNAKIPYYGMLIARGKFLDLDILHSRLTRRSVFVACATAAAMWVLCYLSYSLDLTIAKRVLPPLPTGLFLLTSVLVQLSISQAVYLRAHKREPFLGLSLIQAALTASSTWFLGKQFGPTGIAVGYLAIILFLVLPFGTAIWRQCRKEWHGIHSS